jgi:hypothetical protein
MKQSPKSFGFNYQFGGRTFALLADTRDEAEARVAAMAHAKYVSELSPQPQNLSDFWDRA